MRLYQSFAIICLALAAPSAFAQDAGERKRIGCWSGMTAPAVRLSLL